jgi:hypothetical protein
LAAPVGQLIVSERFGTSARQGENGFMGRRIVSSWLSRRNIRERNTSNFNERKIWKVGYGRPFQYLAMPGRMPGIHVFEAA